MQKQSHYWSVLVLLYITVLCGNRTGSDMAFSDIEITTKWFPRVGLCLALIFT